MGRRRIVVVGGVAGGASCAARLRRLDEDAEIVIFDRGHFASFANCGLPYYVGDVISDESRLLVATPELFRTRFNIQVHTQEEATAIDRDNRTIAVKNLKTGDTRSEPYDVLVLAPGRRRSGRHCLVLSWTECSRSGPSLTAGEFVSGSRRPARETRLLLAPDSSAWKWRRIS